jgi:hypothetical protein
MPGSTNLPAGTAEDKRTETVIDRAAPTVSGLAVRLRSIRWKHAFAEVFLIVVGVLTALAVNNWNDERRQRRVEVAMLGQLRAELARDLVVLRAMDDEIRERESRMVALLGDLERGSLPGDASDARFGAVLRIWEPPLSRSVYETLKVRGLDLVANDGLRLRVVKLYEDIYVNLDGGQADDRTVVFDLVRPYYLTHFRGIRFGDSATPLSHSAVIHDPYFRNLVEYRLTSLRVNPIANLQAALTEITELVAALDATIGRRP